MSGPTELLLDTNAVVKLLRGDSRLQQITSSANRLCISVVTLLEFRSFRGLTANDSNIFNRWAARIDVIDLRHDAPNLLDAIVAIRLGKALRLPDAIIAGTAVALSLQLVTNDQQLITAVPALRTLSF